MVGDDVGGSYHIKDERFPNSHYLFVYPEFINMFSRKSQFVGNNQKKKSICWKFDNLKKFFKRKKKSRTISKASLISGVSLDGNSRINFGFTIRDYSNCNQGILDKHGDTEKTDAASNICMHFHLSPLKELDSIGNLTNTTSNHGYLTINKDTEETCGRDAPLWQCKETAGSIRRRRNGICHTLLKDEWNIKQHKAFLKTEVGSFETFIINNLPEYLHRRRNATCYELIKKDRVLEQYKDFLGHYLIKESLFF